MTAATGRRVHFVAYEIGASSPAQPRVAAWLRGLLEAGIAVTVHTERHPGAWIDVLASHAGLRVAVIRDPVRRLSARLRGTRSVGPAAGPEAGEPGVLWRLGYRVQARILFPDPESIWSRRVARRVARAVAPGDLVVTFSRPESAGFAGLAAQRRGASWWFDFADGWCTQGLRREAMQPGRRRERELALERRWVAGADVVSTVDAGLAAAFARLRARPDVQVFPNIVPDELVVADPGTGSGSKDRVVIGYFGRLSGSDEQRSLAPLLAVLRRAVPKRVRFVFCGEYLARDLVEIDALRGLGCEVEVRGAVPRSELVALRAGFDAALVVGSPAQPGSSSKLLDVLGLALPVIAFVAVPSVAAGLVRDAACGEVIALDVPSDALTTWNRFLDGVGSRAYRVDPSVRDRYTSAAFVPGLVKRVLALLAAPVAPP